MTPMRLAVLAMLAVAHLETRAIPAAQQVALNDEARGYGGEAGIGGHGKGMQPH